VTFLTFILVSFLLLSSCGDTAQYPLGSKENPIKFLFTPSVESTSLVKNSAELIRYLEKNTNLVFKTSVPTNYITVIESFGSNRADIAILNSFGYLLAHSKYGATAEAIVIRNNTHFYWGQIIAHRDSGITKIEDIQGKNVAYTDPSSLSGYLFPKLLLNEKKIVPKRVVFGMKHDIVVTMVYQRQVDAGATFYTEPNGSIIRDARANVLTQFPDVEDKVKIIQLTQKIPNDPVVFRKEIPRDIVEKVVSTIISFSHTEDGKRVLNSMYGIDGVTIATDSAFDNLREVINSSDIELGDVLKK
jgi:phosphonate transport system substrate-binding protein